MEETIWIGISSPVVAQHQIQFVGAISTSSNWRNGVVRSLPTKGQDVTGFITVTSPEVEERSRCIRQWRLILAT